MAKTRNRVVAIACAVLLVFGLFAFGASPAAGASADYSSDLRSKVAKLPIGDTDNIYIINNLDNRQIKLPIKQSFQTVMGTVSMVSIHDVIFFDTFDNLAPHTNFTAASNPTDAQKYNALKSTYEGLINSVYVPGSALPWEGCVMRDYGKSFVHGYKYYLDIGLSGKSYLQIYSNACDPAYTDAPDASTWLGSGYRWYSVANRVKHNAGYMDYVINETLYYYVVYEEPHGVVTFTYRDAAGKNTYEVFTLPYDTDLTEYIPNVPDAPYCKSGDWLPLIRPVNSERIEYRMNYVDTVFHADFRDYYGNLKTREDFTYYQKIVAPVMGEIRVDNGNVREVYRFDTWRILNGGEEIAVDLTEYRLTADTVFVPKYKLFESVDLNTGEVTGGEQAGCSGNFFTFKWISDIWESAGKVPVIGGFLRILWVIALVVLGLIAVPVIVLIIKAIIALVSLIINLFKKIFRRG